MHMTLVLRETRYNKTIVALNDVIKCYYVRSEETLGSVIVIYDTHSRCDIELNSLITSGHD